ncbi:GIY-YIG nuclease family protein [Vibrio sp. SCSIO 43132]|uniref:GIY-YIG nuclease family protein n=1 Tax=Vibrio sp. SCSIO 43132 TaxID=2779363 RepID=UPI001CA8CB9F|nr:GIY-YIG nuclease family protein [Vibrio sp. SCSIO 43132]UAB71685.1 GIY-YIG nuclease family protein [Vibrio sp. SCSIO 43132]
MEYLDRLIDTCNKAKTTSSIAEFKATSFDDIPDIERGIYIIQEIGGNSDFTYQSFVDFKQKKLKACSRVNAPSSVLYVGSSTTGLKKRLKQHLISCPDKTYSLHMYAWFEGAYEVRILQYDAPSEIIQLIEDGISFELSPAFGKQGGNNK